MKNKIYPTPKKIEYLEGFIEFDYIEFDYHDIDDEAIKSKIIDISSRYNGKTNKLVVDINIDDSLENAYKLDVEEKINIKASDYDMAFYALVTLERLLDFNKNKIEKIKIFDYPSLQIRGVVEGYYGIPYGFEQRVDMMKFGAKYKNNAYIYAPKDDPFHRERWFDLYDEEKLEEIKKLADLGNRLKNIFVWTIAPFYEQKIDLDNFDQSMEKIIAKFEQLYNVGVRQFGVLGDDVGILDPKIPVMMMNELSNWKSKKDDLRDFVYCPGSYSLGDGLWDPKELNEYEKEFPIDVHLFHTGEKVCAPISKSKLDEYKTKDTFGNERRNPLFWLNFPVNDIDPNIRKLHLGELSMVDNKVDNLVGAVTNPMQETYASMIALFGISDYGWNLEAFDSKTNHEDSLIVLEPKAHEDLKIIAKHMSNQDNRGIHGLKESWDIKDLLVEDIDKSNLSNIKVEFKNIIDACDNYLNKASNVKLRNDLEPFVLNLKEKLEGSNYLIDAIESIENKELSKFLYKKSLDKFFEANDHYIYVNPEKSKIFKTESGTLYINPFINKLQEKAKELFPNTHITEPEVLYYPGMDNSKYYRIPLLYKTMEGTLISVVDRRNNTFYDWDDIDTVIRRKEKGKDFDNQIRVIDLPDLKDDEVSAFSIDASMLQSKKTKRLFLFVTAFPTSTGYFDSHLETGSGYLEKDGKKYLELLDKRGEVLYLDGDKVKTKDGKDTSFTIYIDQKQPFKRMGDIYQGNMMLGNIFVGNGPLELRKVSHILMTYSDDDGKTWQNLQMLNQYIKEDYMRFMGVSPSRGYELDNGRLVFPAYFTDINGRESSCLIVSDDHGKTWQRKATVNDGRMIGNKVININEEYDITYQAGESSLVKHKNGDLRLIVRNFRTGLPRHFDETVSSDDGDSFRNYTNTLDFKTQSWCQMGTYLFEKDGEEYLMVSGPSSYGMWKRLNGKINLLKFDGDEFKFVDSYNLDQGFFGYSSIEKLEDDRFAIVYERAYDLNGENIEIVYREFDLKIFEKYKSNYEYNISPKVQFIEYENKINKFNGFSKDKVNADEYVINKVDSLVERFGSGDIKLNIEIDENISDKYDYYELTISDEINIVGVNNDATYYALLTLEQILSQMYDNHIRSLHIKDFANQKIRGVIEGYYGIPWGNKKRADIMRFTSSLKGNVFIFAPKDDPYHRDKWDELYPEKELEEISKLAKLGTEIKTRYVWTISPFKKDSNPITEDNFDESIQKLIAKFEQLYKNGVRQFGVLGDDVGKLPKETVVKVMRAVSEWGMQKGDLYDFLFVPASYVLADWGFDGDELDIYSKDFPKNVQIMFTGEITCAPVTQNAIDGFKTKETKIGERRDPLFWMNWPVNDIDRTETIRVFMGKGEMYDRGVSNIVGTITNPMQEAYASFPAIFQTCDYAWNTDLYDYEKSWENAFRFIEEDTAIYLNEIARHMSSADNGGIEGLEESKEIGELFENLLNKIKHDSYEYEFYTRELIEKFDIILDAIENFMKLTKFEGLKEDLHPYISSLYYKSLTAKYLLKKYLMNKLEYNKEDIDNLSQLAQESFEKSKSFMVATKTQEFPATELIATSGTKVIDKIIEYLMKN